MPVIDDVGHRRIPRSPSARDRGHPQFVVASGSEGSEGGVFEVGCRDFPDLPKKGDRGHPAAIIYLELVLKR
jgi:hypothetical protein